MKVVRDSIIYLGSSVINKLIPFILLPITTSFLSPEDFGKYSIYYLFVTIYLAIIGMGINTNISKNFFSKSKEELALMHL
jgi:O-antigen/teichoic acid export membrane protein